MRQLYARVVAVAFAALLLGVLGTTITGPTPALADVNCGNDHRLRVDIIDDETGDLLALPGTSVEIDPDPQDGTGSRDYVDNGANDDNPAVGRIDEQDACEVTGTGTGPTAYTVQVEDLPDDDCELNSADSQSTALTGNSAVTFHVEDCDPGVSSVVVAANPTAVACSGTSTITVTLQSSDGAVPDGTQVTLSTNFGTVSPTTAGSTNGTVTAIYTGPSTSGTATVQANAMGQSGTATVTVSCGAPIQPGQPAQLHFPQTSCGATANTSFSWIPGGGVSQWLDLSINDNGFAFGSFIGAGPMSPAVTSLQWNGLIPGLAHYWRINTFTGSEWVTSASGTFVPCGGPQLRGISYACTGAGTASTTFFWSPSSPAGFQSWIDLSLSNNGFAFGFIGAGPLSPTQQQFTWQGIWAGPPHYWRVNTEFSNGWTPSPTGQFTAFC